MKLYTGLKLRRRFKELLYHLEIKKPTTPKVFGVGFNKTGTTSLTKAMEELGFRVGSEGTARTLFNDWSERKFSDIIDFCREPQFFQDFPFSLPYTYIVMDQVFPDSKFVLTIRDSPEQWYNSMVYYIARKWGNGSNPPTASEMKNSNFYYKGHHWEAHKEIFSVAEDDPWNKEILIEHYNRHNKSVIDYFKKRQHDLLILNVADSNAYEDLMNFLNIESEFKNFPWLNKSDELKDK